MPVIASDAEDRPWKPPSAATMTRRLLSGWARRTTLTAASLASVPELARNTLPSGAPSRPSSRSASSTCGSCRNRLEACASRLTWRLTASVSAGWAWPSALTAMPAIRSVYCRPSTSQTWLPRP